MSRNIVFFALLTIDLKALSLMLIMRHYPFVLHLPCKL